MRAVVTRPGAARAWVAEIPEPTFENTDDVVVEMLRVGVCGTDRHVMARPIGDVRALPKDADYLVMGHEAVGRVVRLGSQVNSLKLGDVVVPTVRRGCGECAACAVDQSDLCFTGRIKERGIPTWALARGPADGPAARLIERSGATYVPLQEVDLEQPQARLGGFDAIVEATGAVELSVGMLGALGPNGVLDLAGGVAERKA